VSAIEKEERLMVVGLRLLSDISVVVSTIFDGACGVPMVSSDAWWLRKGEDPDSCVGNRQLLGREKGVR